MSFIDDLIKTPEGRKLYEREGLIFRMALPPLTLPVLHVMGNAQRGDAKNDAGFQLRTTEHKKTPPKSRRAVSRKD
ncbi:MAG: hypothetical protein ACP5QA_08725 [Phycisphaerae bacterium]